MSFLFFVNRLGATLHMALNIGNVLLQLIYPTANDCDIFFDLDVIVII